MTIKKIQVDVCIVGAGPSGTLLGYLLAKNGVSTLVIERTAGNTPAFRGEHINAETEQILNEHQLFEKIEEKGLLRVERVEFIKDGRALETIFPNADEEHVGIHVPQSHLISTIIDDAVQYPNFHHMFNTKGTGLIEDNGVYCGVKAKQGDNDWFISCSVVVGADGRYSTIRELAEIPYDRIEHGYDVLWAKIPAPAGWEPTVRLLLIEGHQLAIFTQACGNIQIGWNIPSGSFSELKKQSLDPFLKPLLENFPELKETVSENLRSWKDIVFLEVFSSKSATWVKEGLIIIGDSAHTMTPTAAIGINAGIKDAYLLAPILTDVFKSKKQMMEPLKKFEEERRVEVERLQQQQLDEEKDYSSNFC